MRQPLLDAVRGLDPATEAPDIDGEELLARIRRERTRRDHGDVAHLLPRHRSRPAQRIAMGAAALLTITVVALVLTLTQRGPQAYASWVESPVVVPAEQVADRCPQVEAGPPDIPVEPVLAEQRGSYTFVVLSGDGVFVECLISTARDEPFVMAQGTTLPDPDAFDMGLAPALVLDPGSTWGSEGGEGPITTVVGLADDGVTSIQISTTDGVQAQAAVADGWWSVWFPGDVDVSDELIVVTAEGQSALSLSALIAPGAG